MLVPGPQKISVDSKQDQLMERTSDKVILPSSMS